jgi:glycosyltransferase involved in cell wall biosynthesis
VSRRILLLLTDLQIGGTPTVVREVAARLHDPPGVEVTVACLDREGPVAEQIRRRGPEVVTLDARSRHDLRVIRRLAELINRQGIDTVLSFLVHANAAAAMVATASPGVRFFQSIQTTQPRPRWHWLVQRLCARAAEKIIVPSPSVAAVARRWAKVEEEKIVMIPNGVDMPASPPRPVPPASPHRLVFLGRLDPIKRLPDLLTAMTYLRDIACLDVFGEGPQRPLLTRQILALDLASVVTLHGSVPDALTALRGAELLILPSEAEGFGLVLIEAMAAGVPVVATEVPGIRDVIRNGVTGVLVPVGAPQALADAVRRVLADDSLRQALTSAAFADVSRRFTWERAIAAYRLLLGI